jgi:hydrogenase expression/formation protein HypE
MSESINPEDINCPRPISDHRTVQLGHGSGGALSHDLIGKLFVSVFNNRILDKQDDHALLDINGQKLAFSTDSYVIDPIFFPGGDIGELAVNGTINDLCMGGGRPLYISAGFIIEEGFAFADLERIVKSMKAAADKAGVQIVTGDTKVVHKGKADKVFINTAGIAVVEHPYRIDGHNLQVADVVIVSGTIADHGIAVLAARENLSLRVPVNSDTAALNHLVETILRAGGAAVHAMRDPTRGGVAATLNELAGSSHVGIRLTESSLPVAAPVHGACELLGLDPLYVANEGKLLVSVAKAASTDVLAAMRRHPLGKDAAVIGDVVAADPGIVSISTVLGAWRIVDMPVGLQLPRIC